MTHHPLAVTITSRMLPPDRSRWQRAWRAAGRISIAACMYTALFALAAYILLRAWQGMPWRDFWFTLIYVALAPLTYLPWSLITAASQRCQRRLTDLLWGDLAVMADCPLVDPQPAKLVVSGLPIDPVPVAEESYLSLFASTDTARSRFSGMPGARSIVFLNTLPQYILPLLILLEHAFGLAARFGGAYDSMFFVLSASFMLTGFSILWFPLIAKRRGNATMTVTADHAGLHWGDDHHLPWGEIQRFVCQTNRRKEGRISPGSAYLIESATIKMQWHVARKAASSTKRASEFLQQLVISHTDVPLRDVTAFSEAMNAIRGDLRRLIARRRANGQDVASLETIAAQVYPTPVQQRRQQVAGNALIGLILAPIVILGILGGRVQSMQGTYFAALPGRLLRETPLYHASMRQPDGDWPVAAPTPGHAFGAQYTNGGYQLHGSLPGEYIAALMPGTYADAAVAVTVTFAPLAANQDGSEAGIVVRADPTGQHDLIFTVDSDGFGWLGRICELHAHTSIDACQSLLPDINQLIYDLPQATTLHLMVVMHGGSFLFYINGQLYGTYTDAAQLIPASGRIGLFSGDSSQRVTFTDVTIVPARGQAPWDYA
jgi:hypothetical protein